MYYGAVWDGMRFLQIRSASGLTYQGLNIVTGSISVALLSSERTCDFTYPDESFEFPLTFTQNISSTLNTSVVDNPATISETLNAYTLTVTTHPTVSTFNTVYDSFLPFTPKELVFIPDCLTDLEPSMGQADLSVDLAACVLYNGAALSAPV